VTYEYRAPERLEDDWESGVLTPPDEIRDELSADVAAVLEASSGGGTVPVQGRVSDYKSWLAASAALEASDAGDEVTVFAPQRANRESAVFKLREFGADLIEHPGRLDLCVWEPWRENVGRVDRSTCESIGCPYYVDSDADVADRTDEALSQHALESGGSVDLGTEDMRRLGEERDFCPAQLYLRARRLDHTDGAVNVATYAKAFTDAVVSEDDPLDSDLLLLDEAHTVAAEPDLVREDVDPRAVASNVASLLEYLDGVAEGWANRHTRELALLEQSVEGWAMRSETEHVEPGGAVAGETLSLSDCFDAVDTVESRLRQSMRRATRSSDWESVQQRAGPFQTAKSVRSFLSSLVEYREGRADFVHSRYTVRGDDVNKMSFRRRADAAEGEDGPGAGVEPDAVYREWQRRGTHPAVAERWGTVLDHYIEEAYQGRRVVAAGGRAGVPMEPLERLKEIAGTDNAVCLSATHNDLSDPTRPADRLRETRHELVTAPLLLRSEGSAREDYDGSESVSPATPWFRSLVEAAADESGDTLAAVPINLTNAQLWEGMPVETLETEDGAVSGVVPNSRGSIGEKGLEEAPVDTVLCGVQAQSPANTARRLVSWWDMIAPRADGPGEVLDTSWRLLAQHVVSGTIQAGGRFRWDATNLLFERPSLVRLAGFECREATPDDGGFAGALARLHAEADREWADRRAAARAAKTARYLAGADRKTPSTRQMQTEYARIYDTDEKTARRALAEALDRGELAAEAADGGRRYKPT